MIGWVDGWHGCHIDPKYKYVKPAVRVTIGYFDPPYHTHEIMVFADGLLNISDHQSKQASSRSYCSIQL